MNIIEFNQRIKRIGVLVEICHCTNRYATPNANVIVAKCIQEDILKGKLQWHYSGGLARFSLTTPFGASVGDNLHTNATDDEIYDTIHGLYTQMHTYWTGET